MGSTAALRRIQTSRCWVQLGKPLPDTKGTVEEGSSVEPVAGSPTQCAGGGMAEAPG